MIDIRFYGRGELNRSGVRIAPDGTLSYLQVNSLKVGSKTIDELRFVLEEALVDYYRNPRLIITPRELKSKRYVILGKVVDKGVFTWIVRLPCWRRLRGAAALRPASFSSPRLNSPIWVGHF